MGGYRVIAHSNTEDTMFRNDVEGDSADVECPRVKGRQRVRKYVWRAVPGNQSQDGPQVELSRRRDLATQDSPSDGFSTIMPEQGAVEPDPDTSHDTGALVNTIGRLATEASVLTDQLSVMA